MITKDVRNASGWVIFEQENYVLELYLVIIIIFWAIRNVMIECKAFIFSVSQVSLILKRQDAIEPLW